MTLSARQGVRELESDARDEAARRHNVNATQIAFWSGLATIQLLHPPRLCFERRAKSGLEVKSK